MSLNLERFLITVFVAPHVSEQVLLVLLESLLITFTAHVGAQVFRSCAPEAPGLTEVSRLDF